MVCQLDIHPHEAGTPVRWWPMHMDAKSDRSGSRGNMDARREGCTWMQEEETWLSNLLSTSPYLPESSIAPGSFSTDAPEFNSHPHIKDQTFNFRGCGLWYETGLRILNAAGWCPGCVKTDPMNLGRTLPPQCRKGAWIKVGSFDAMGWINDSPKTKPDGTYVLDMRTPLELETAPSFRSTAG